MDAAYPIEIIAHRGDRSRFPENTLPAFQSAIDAGATGLELDLLITADHQIVIHHDFSLNPDLCTADNGSELTETPLIYSLPLSFLKTLDCGRKTDPRFKGVRIPTLRELFDLCGSRPDILLNLELKCEPLLTPLPELFARLVLKETALSSSPILYSSFNAEVLSALRKIKPDARLLFLFGSENLPLARVLETARALNVEALGPDESLLTPESMEQLKPLRVIPWTVNDPARWRQLIDLGVSGIITDTPQELVRFLSNSN